MMNERLERTIYTALKIGMVLSASLLVIGLILPALAVGMAPYFLTAGVFALFATPIAGVATSVFVFAFERNKLYTIITTIVLFDIIVAVFIIPVFMHIA